MRATLQHQVAPKACYAPCAWRISGFKANSSLEQRGRNAAVADVCGNCGTGVPLSGTRCLACQEPIGFPNVRAAELSSETEALSKRVASARDSASTRGISDELECFEEEVSRSKAVMNRSLGSLSSWVNGDSPLFQSFHQQLDHGGRTPHSSVWDQQRASAESSINPFSFQEINFCALTINDSGMSRYGLYSVILKESMIRNRSSVFEENPFIFNKRHNVVSGTNPPSGYRAVWSNRHSLAVAKCHPSIMSGMNVEDFCDVLMHQVGDGADNDYIEVHIYGPVHKNSIEKVSGPNPVERTERAIWRQAKRSLAKIGVRVEEEA